MDLALIQTIPFVLAFLYAIPPLRAALPLPVRTWVATAIMATLFAALLGYYPYIEAAALSQGSVVRVIEWVPQLSLSLTFYLDGLSLLFGLVITGIGAGITLYTGYYFADDPQEGDRFMMWLLAFAGAMLGVVLAGNLITMFILWELTSITSFMLIGFKGGKYADARFGALQAFLLTSVGALALIVGIVMFGSVAGSLTNGGGFVFELDTLLNLDAAAIAKHELYALIVVLVALGAFTKSAQFPFHFWLPGAMSAPTPASAYLHSATMVKAGVYLLARLYPPLHLSDLWVSLLVSVGVLTMLIGAVFALTKRDLKGLLAYSTVSALGSMVALIGLPNYEGMKAAMVTIMAHALYKAALFLSVGTIEHNTGSRNVDELGGLRQYMPRLTGVVAVSVLSMAGLFPFFGFVAKETLLDGFLKWKDPNGTLVLAVIAVAATLTVAAGLMVFWDVFIKPAPRAIHYHDAPVWLDATPILLAVGSFAFSVAVGFGVIFQPFLQTIVPKTFELKLLPPDGFANTAFQISTAALLLGAAAFALRHAWLPALAQLERLPVSGSALFKAFVAGLDKIGDVALRLQSGQIRYYLIVIFIAASLMIWGYGAVENPLSFFGFALKDPPTFETWVRTFMLVLACAAAFFSIIQKNHLFAALTLGVTGYSIGVIFLLEPAPDVAVVQFLVETLTTILIILILGRISQKQREDASNRLWKGYLQKRTGFPIGVLRDVAIAGMVGTAVFFFTLAAMTTRTTTTEVVDCAQGFVPAAIPIPIENDETGSIVIPRSLSIAAYHLCNTKNQLGVTDVVGAIVADYRAMDTLLEIVVFAVAALGVLTMLSRGLSITNPLAPRQNRVAILQEEWDKKELAEIKDATDLATPFTKLVARIVLALGFLVAASHIVTGGDAPGDGFTAGAFLGLAVSLWYVVYGYREALNRLRILRPYYLLMAGLALGTLNALLPLLWGQNMLSFVNYGAWIGVDGLLKEVGLKFTTTLVFEVSIFLTVFGGFMLVTETIAHPKAADMEDSPLKA